MATIDEKVVAMNFDSSKFESGVGRTISALDKLKAALHLPGAGKGLADIQAQADRTNLSKIGQAVETIKDKFSALNLVALQVLGNIATKAVAAGARLVKSLTLDPVIQGYKEYETKLGSIQTILANTQTSGTKLKDVTKALDELNRYSDETIYNFGQMAKNVGTFTAAGVDLKTSVASIKGIANLAALSGANSEKASNAMYQLSQAIAAGRVSLQDWNSVVHADMGGAVFQRALAQTATAMGKLDAGALKLSGNMKTVTINGESFRNSISSKSGEESWLTSEVLTNTLQQFTGDLSDAELAAQGFNQAQIDAIKKTAATAKAAATEVKTLTALVGTTKEQLGSGWAQTFEIIFGNFTEAKTLWTGVSQVIGGFVLKSAEARNKMLSDWKALGGRTALIDGIKNAFQGLMSVVTPIKDAFRQIFPPTTGKQLYDLTVRFRDFMAGLKLGPETAENLKRTFAGVFAIFSIGKQIIGGIIRVFARLFGAIAGGTGGFLAFTGGIGDFLVSVDKALKKGDALNKFFDALGDILAVPIEMVMSLTSAIFGLFTGFDAAKGGTDLTDSLTKMGNALTPMGKLLNGVTDAFAGFFDMLKDIGRAMAPMLGEIGESLSKIGEVMAGAFEGASADTFLTSLEVGLVGGIAVMIKKFISSFKEGMGGPGILDSIKDSFDALSGSLQAMQQNIKANTLLQIAAAVGILTASVVALSMIDAEALQKALYAMAVGFGQLLGAMAILTNITKSAAFLKVPFIAASLILLAGAVAVMTFAVKNLSGLSWGELIKGLTGVAALLGIIAVASGPLGKSSAGLIRAGVGMMAIGLALKVLASAVADFGGLSWTELGKGMLAVAAALVGIGYAAQIFPAGMVKIGVGLIAVALGLKILSSAVGSFADLSWGEIGKGILTIAAAMVTIAIAMTLMPPNMFVTAAGLLVVAVALKGIASVLGTLGGMSVGALAKGIISMALALTILGVAMYAFTGAVAGAAALAVAAASIALLAPALVALGKQSWGSILKGLVGLAAAFVVLGVAGYLLTPVVPALLGLGAALLLIGGGLALAGAGIMFIGTGLAAIAASGGAAIGILINSLTRLIEAIPRMAVSFVQGLLAIVDQIATVAPKFMVAFVKILITLIDAIIQIIPKAGKALIVLINTMLDVIESTFPRVLDTGFRLLMQLLDGIKNNMPKIVEKANEVVLAFIQAMVTQQFQFVNMGGTTLGNFLKGVSDKLRNVVTTAHDVVSKFVGGIGDNLGRIVSAGGEAINNFINGVRNGFDSVTHQGRRAVVEFAEGIRDRLSEASEAAQSVVTRVVNAIGSLGSKLAHEARSAIGDLADNLKSKITEVTDSVRSKANALGGDIIGGLLSGLASGASSVINKLASIAGNALAAAKRRLKSKSPSKEFITLGEDIMKGWVIGIESGAKALDSSVTDAADTVINTTAQAFGSMSQVIADAIDANPTITPILDLTAVQSGAATMNSLLNVVPITAAASYGQASTIAASQNSVQTALDDNIVAPGGTQIKFEQNNYSPEALSSAEIYRQTRNQLSIAKTALAV